MRKPVRLLRTTLKSLILAITVSNACIPLLAVELIVPFSAKLTDKQGVPLDGQYAITFRIYTEPAGGQPVWTEVHNAANVSKGVLSVNLGSVSSFGALELLEGYWLGIAVGADAEMTQRVQVPAQVIVPAGTIVPFGGSAEQVPKGWLLCDGRELVAASYPRLYKAIGKAWGSSAADMFRVPDLRGLFLRGVDGTANRDPDKASRTAIAAGGNAGANAGSYQTDEFKTHKHVFGGTATLPALGYVQQGNDMTQNASHSGTGSRNYYTKESPETPGRAETRPKNAYVNYIVKY